jgi:hypothetical protein
MRHPQVPLSVGRFESDFVTHDEPRPCGCSEVTLAELCAAVSAHGKSFSGRLTDMSETSYSTRVPRVDFFKNLTSWKLRFSEALAHRIRGRFRILLKTKQSCRDELVSINFERVK